MGAIGQTGSLTLQTVSLPSDEANSQPIIEAIDDRIIVRVAEVTGPLPQTIRWKYAIQIARPG